MKAVPITLASLLTLLSPSSPGLEARTQNSGQAQVAVQERFDFKKVHGSLVHFLARKEFREDVNFRDKKYRDMTLQIAQEYPIPLTLQNITDAGAKFNLDYLDSDIIIIECPITRPDGIITTHFYITEAGATEYRRGQNGEIVPLVTYSRLGR